MISLVPARSGLQHEIDRKNEADTARNPYFIGLSSGALGEIRTPDPRIRSPMLRANNQSLNATPCVKPSGNDQRVTRVLSNPPLVVQRDDGLFEIGFIDALGPFESRAFALMVASDHQPTPASRAKFRRVEIIREVPRAASS